MVRGMRHEWTDALTNIACAADAIPDRLDGGLTEEDLRALEGKRFTVHGTAGREILRLAERERKLRASLNRLVLASSGDDWEEWNAAREASRYLLKEE